MLRVFLVVAGVVLFVAGLIGTAVSFDANGWTVLAAVGVACLRVVLWLEERIDRAEVQR